MEMSANLVEDFSGLDKLVDGIEGEGGVLFSGAAAMALVFYDEAHAQALKHAKTFDLFNAIYRAWSPEQSTPSKVVYHVSWNKTKAPHGHLIEFGTSKAPPFPFIRPAFAFAQAAVDAGTARMAERMTEIKGS